jgi:hypothetical protein
VILSGVQLFHLRSNHGSQVSESCPDRESSGTGREKEES